MSNAASITTARVRRFLTARAIITAFRSGEKNELGQVWYPRHLYAKVL